MPGADALDSERVDALLAQNERHPGFLEAADALDVFDGAELDETEAPDLEPGTRVGPYKILEQVGYDTTSIDRLADQGVVQVG